MSEQTQCDVVVVGTGPGGEDAAGRLAEAGLHVVAVERALVGGECPYWGCIPSKMLVRAADALAEARRVPELAGDARTSPDFGVVARRIRDEATTNWDDTIAAQRLEGRGATLVRGEARIVERGVVRVGDAEYAPRRGILLNTGTSPAVPPIDGLADTPYWTNHEILETDTLPTSLAVIGGGAIGLELAQAFARFGTDVTVLEAAPRILAVEEPEAADVLTDVFGKERIGVRAGATIESVSHDGVEFAIAVDGETVRTQRLLVSTGRTPNIRGIGLDAYDVDASGKSLDVDSRQRVTDGLWAIGDITGKGGFTHVSTYQSDIAVRDILSDGGPDADYRALPRVTFTDPEVGAVGLTEQQARDQGVNVRTAYTDITASSRGFLHKVGNEGFIKLVADADRDVLVGATSAGPAGGEVLAGLAIAIRGEVSVTTLRNNIWAYPTFHRAIETAVAELA